MLFSWCGMLRFYAVPAVVLYLGWPYAIWKKSCIVILLIRTTGKSFACMLYSFSQAYSKQICFSWDCIALFLGSLLQFGTRVRRCAEVIGMLCWVFYLCLFCSVLFFCTSLLPLQSPQSRRKELTYIFTVYMQFTSDQSKLMNRDHFMCFQLSQACESATANTQDAENYELCYLCVWQE